MRASKKASVRDSPLNMSLYRLRGRARAKIDGHHTHARFGSVFQSDSHVALSGDMMSTFRRPIARNA